MLGNAKNHENSNFHETWFLQWPHAKCLVFESQISRFRPRKSPENKTETSMNNYTFFGPGCPESFQNGTQKSSPNQEKSKLGLRSALACDPKSPRIAPKSAKIPEWRARVCQMTDLGTKNDNVCSHKGKESQVVKR